MDEVLDYEYEGQIYRMLRVSDADELFSGDIICEIGHLTSFFPERLMNRDKNYSVEGVSLRSHHHDWQADTAITQIHALVGISNGQIINMMESQGV